MITIIAGPKNGGMTLPTAPIPRAAFQPPCAAFSPYRAFARVCSFAVRTNMTSVRNFHSQR